MRWIAEKLKLSGFNFFLCFYKQKSSEIMQLRVNVLNAAAATKTTATTIRDVTVI